jgi:hypothetical protein
LVDSEQLVVAVANMVHAKVNASLVGSRANHQVRHGFENI